jgi:hypothetical protein
MSANMSGSNVMTRSRTAALRVEEATAALRVEEAHAALRVEDATFALRVEQARGPGSLHEYQLEMGRRPYLVIMKREDAEQLRVYEVDGPSTSYAEEQSCFTSVVWNVAEEFGHSDDVARYMCERDLRLTLLDSFHVLLQRLEDKKT